MKDIWQIIIISIFLLFSIKINSQDVSFSQFENTPIYLNPGLTGKFEGKARIIVNYRNQWRSILHNNSYRTGLISLDSKFEIGNSNKIGVGFNTLRDRAGELNFGTNQYNFLTSIIHDFDKKQNGYHSISIGVNFGFASRQFDIEKSDPPIDPEIFNSEIHYLNFSTGFLWEYNSNSRFSFQLGSAIHNMNKPNVSFYETGEANLNIRFNLHGNAEIPIVRKTSLIPSFMLTSQGARDLLLFGIANRLYFKHENLSNFFDIGLYAKTTNDIIGKFHLVTYVLTAVLDLNSFSIGFSYDHFPEIDSEAYEFSIGYIINSKKIANRENIVLIE